MIEKGESLHAVPITQGWVEFDTEQDLNRISPKSLERKTAYVAIAADFLHHGHINIISEASKLGDVIIGLLTDEAIAKYKRLPLLTFEQRKNIIKSIKGVSAVCTQSAHDYTANLKMLKPNYVVHGDDWKTGILKEVREKAIETLNEWGGELVEIPYTKGVSARELNKDFNAYGITSDIRRQMLRRLLKSKPIVRALEAHNGLTGLLIENTRIEHNNSLKEFDCIWISSLTDSTSRGKPDIGCVDLTSRMSTMNDVLEVTTKPLIFDGDSGGLTEHFIFMVKTLERLGVSAVIIEDKVGLKKNSLFGTDVSQTQDTIINFSNKISEGKKAQVTEDFMVIARIESLILKKGLEDALTRAEAYIDAGADAIMIHSKEQSPDEILEFCKRYKQFNQKVPLIVVPSMYSSITEDELIDAGVNLVIYANHLLRSAFPAMTKAAESILKNGRSQEASENFCMPIKEILTLIPEGGGLKK
jgi:phosphoenolpyruvate phosphomutase / 2-hydroxyethylphosphonate cytidylyltransferase